MRPWTGSWRWIMLILLAWGTLLFYIGGHLVRDNDHPDRSSRELSKILAKLERLKQQNEDLRRMAESLSVLTHILMWGRCARVNPGMNQVAVPQYKGTVPQYKGSAPQYKGAVPQYKGVLGIPEGPIDQGPASAGRVRALEEQLIKAKEQIENFRKQAGDGPGKNQEILQRRISNGVKELWYFIRSELKKVTQMEGSDLQKYTAGLLEDLGHQQRSIMTDLHYLSQTDGAGEWREKEARDLSNLVQNRITYLQNPKDCSKARKLVCNINKGCGYGCQLHHVVYCFMIAYGTQRTLILESQNWRYATSGWESVFKAVSESCTDRSGTSTGHWSGLLQNKKVLNTKQDTALDAKINIQTKRLNTKQTVQDRRTNTVCRVAYEIMQTLHPDASSHFHSLDDIYYFGGQNAHNQIAIYPHQPRTGEEILLEPGDVIGVAGNHWDGYSKGMNRKMGRTGLYPSYKVKEKIETVKYPTYPEADKQLPQ
ncbi:UNVERIFIED_CONTAM: hypothetical protein FKN15_045569 [Acipenser sinensis]